MYALTTAANTGSCSAPLHPGGCSGRFGLDAHESGHFYVTRYEKHFREVMEQKLRLSSEEAIRGTQKASGTGRKRLTELDRLFIRIYEDNVAGAYHG